ncbi:MAG: trehalose-phosphatase [Candidatus Odinarchaeum yellowstonii]|uniref:Trehalose 6-phosphate phosphatase n=1 Tax=Odinarchaeota yellowstonii (strain LCB_4) TaxID=1841599 RepID=A0AAF0IBZ7_ODILC|nr:MAG: trehalose-phosphatase [Candidatus Odinarchaeum yellowstonii]
MSGVKPIHLFKALSEIELRMRKAERIIIFTDYDGTLIPTAERPELAVADEELKTLLNNLASNPRIKIIIASGRAIQTLKRLIPLKNVIYAGDHGINVEFPSGEVFTWRKAKLVNPLVEEIYRELSEFFKNERGVIIEKKNSNLSVHYRLLTDFNKIRETVQATYLIVEKCDKNNLLQVFTGSKIVEIRAKGWDKGKVVEIAGRKLKITSRDLVFFIGDDVTDEDGFRKIKPTGVSVIVKNGCERETVAEYFLNDPFELRFFLHNLPLKLVNSNI